MNGDFHPGGSSTSWRASNGYYYRNCRIDQQKFGIIKSSEPDSDGRYASVDTIYQQIETDRSIGVTLGTDDNMNFYYSYRDLTKEMKGVFIYDEEFNKVDEFLLLPREENDYMQYIKTIFLRHDGNIYEFHIRDDGMHVFRWSDK